VPIVFFIDPYTQSFIVESIGYHNPKRFLFEIKDNNAIVLKRKF